MESQVSSRVLADSGDKSVFGCIREGKIDFPHIILPQGSRAQGQERSPGLELYPGRQEGGHVSEHWLPQLCRSYGRGSLLFAPYRILNCELQDHGGGGGWKEEAERATQRTLRGH